jgi:energy-coupling factor transport system ATP-binding protein
MRPSCVAVEDIAEGRAGRFVWLTGNNFSGRSAVLKKACEHFIECPGAAISVPPEVHNAISGLVPSVQEELTLHAGQCEPDNPFWSLADQWGVLRLGKRDPFTLSGGEGAMLVVLCKLALKPELLCVDGALEQLDPDNLDKVMTLFSRCGSLQAQPRIVLTHNGQLPENFSPPLQQLSAKTVVDVTEAPAAPSLDEPGFDPPPVHEPARIDLVDLGFRYRTGTTVFANLNLRLEPGRVYRLAGPNGAGKSTLARLLTGILRPMHGGLRVNGKQFDSYSRPGALAHLHFQSPDSQLFESTVSDELKSLPTESALAATRFAGVAGFLNQHPFDLPFALRKRLAVALILHSSAPWLIFDEPAIGQDQNSRGAIGKALRKLAVAGHGVILISHDAEFAKSFSDEEVKLLPLEWARNVNSQNLQITIPKKDARMSP